MTPQPEFPVSILDGVVTIPLPLRVVVGNRALLAAKVDELLEKGERTFILDFTDCVYLDSSGLAILDRIRRAIERQKGELRIRGLNDDLTMLFDLTRFSERFQIEGVQSPQAHGIRRGD